MSDIREYYQPLYAAINEYKKIHKQWEELNSVYEYLDSKDDKKKGKKKKKKKFKNYLSKAKKKRRKAWKKLLMRSLMYFGIWFMVLLLCVSLVATITPLMLGLAAFWGIVALVFYNKEVLQKVLDKEKEENMLLKYQVGRGQIDEKNVEEILDSLRWDLYQLRQKERPLEAYIKECEQRLMTENSVLVNEILESHGIDAEIEMKPVFKKLSYPGER